MHVSIVHATEKKAIEQEGDKVFKHDTEKQQEERDEKSAAGNHHRESPKKDQQLPGFGGFEDSLRASMVEVHWEPIGAQASRSSSRPHALGKTRQG